MATKFRMDATAGQKPSWCHAAIFPPSIALVNGNPSRLVSFAYWLDTDHVPPIDVNESFILRYRPGPDDWEGSSRAARFRLVVRVQKEPLTALYHIILTIFDAAVELDDDSWHNIDCGVLPQFDSFELHHIHTPSEDENGVHVVA